MVRLILILSVVCAGQSRKRDFVLALWRHGARSPVKFDPFIKDDLDQWPNGPGQLTSFGVELQQGADLIASSDC